MKSIGGWMVIFGLGSFVLGLIGYEFTLLMWVDNWGSAVGWIIRGALVVVGGLLWFTGNNEETANLQESDIA